MELEALSPKELYHACDPDLIPFDTTEKVENEGEILGQQRAVEAIQFGVGIPDEGYNLYLAGSSGLGKRTALTRIIEERAATAPVPPDWCYVDNFDQEHRPRALQLPPGRGRELQRAMEQLVKDLLTAIPAAFQSEEYRTRAQEITHDFEEREEKAMASLGERAQEKGIALIPTPSGYTLAPVHDGKPIDSEEFEKLTDEEKERIQGLIEELKEELRKTIRHIPQWSRESAERFDALNNEFAAAVVGQCIVDLRRQFDDLPDVLAYLDTVERDVVAHKDVFVPAEQKHGKGGGKSGTGAELLRYSVNVLVDNGDLRGAPVVFEDNPTYQNLVGRIEHVAHMGTLVTNFTLIKPGKLHRANGGYLILEAHKVLTRLLAWEALKRALRSKELRIESLEQMLSLASTISLEPESIPLDVKVALTGDRLLYYLLREYDPEFARLFKVIADFSESFHRAPESVAAFSHTVAALCRRHGLAPFDRSGVARVIEHGSRLADDSERLSLHLGGLTDLLRESAHWARDEGSSTVGAVHVQRAIDSRIRRSDQLRERMYDEIRKGTVLIDTDGTRVAQVNGLSVVQLAGFAFGQPSRITATARLGGGEVVDIERESELGGPIHSKGVLILSAFLAHRYAQERPLSLSASLVFEQSYGTVEGDSASVAELCGLISALSGLPIRQDIAVTGSVSQHGQVQPVGGINEKIEGFFDVCRARGLTGRQGVIIPRTNIRHLMLRRDVVEAADRGNFAVYPVGHVDEAIAILTGVAAGEVELDGSFPEGTVNYLVQQRLEEFARLHQEYEKPGKVQSGSEARDEPEA